MVKKIVVYITLNILVWGNISVRAQEITMAEPFSNEGPAYMDLRIKKTNISQSIVIVDGSVSEYGAIQEKRNIYNLRSQSNVYSQVSGGAHIQFQKSSELFAEIGSYCNNAETTNNSEPESSVMMRGPGGSAGGVVDDPVGGGHVLVFFLLIYGFYVYKRSYKRIRE